jgi:hypothetical protein
MKRIAPTVAALALLSGAAALTSAPNAIASSFPHAKLVLTQDQSKPAPPALETFTGTLKKTGDKFVLSDDSTKSSYQLDDQESASKFDGKKVKVTGTLDAANNLIRVQSIEAAA